MQAKAEPSNEYARSVGCRHAAEVARGWQLQRTKTILTHPISGQLGAVWASGEREKNPHRYAHRCAGAANVPRSAPAQAEEDGEPRQAAGRCDTGRKT